MQETPIDPKRNREELKALRELLFKRFLKRPEEIHLALTIKIIDDQVAECCEQLRQNRKEQY